MIVAPDISAGVTQGCCCPRISFGLFNAAGLSLCDMRTGELELFLKSPARLRDSVPEFPEFPTEFPRIKLPMLWLLLNRHDDPHGTRPTRNGPTGSPDLCRKTNLGRVGERRLAK